MVTAPTYCTREQVKNALDYKETARTDQQVDRAIEAASRDVEALCHRVFYPTQASRVFDWPGHQYARPWRLWLDHDELIAVDEVTVAGRALAPGDYFLEPANFGPPYSRLEIDLGSSAAFSSGDTWQHAITITGLFGFADTTTPAGEVAGAVDAATTTVTVTDAAAIGVGSLLRAGTERMLVTGRAMADTGQTTQAALEASNKAVTVPVTDGTQFNVDEVLLVDGERLLVVDIAANTLVVKRAWDGSTLAAHDTATPLYSPRTLTVRRAAAGTTAATHTDGTPLDVWVPPAPVHALAVAEAETQLLQQQSGYARTVGAGDNQRESAGRGVKALRGQVYASHGRKARKAAV